MHGDSPRTRTIEAVPSSPTVPAVPHHPPFWHTLKQDVFFWLLLSVCAVLTFAAPQRLPEYPGLVDWHTIAALAGLLILTKAVESSGMLQLLGVRLVDAVSSERVLALSLVGASAALSTLLTNDVALFVIVPLTVGLRKVAQLPVTRLVIFEALAVNAGSALTPIGNPQNLFLWHQSGLSFGAFVWQMVPLVVLLTVLLLLATWLAFPAHEIHLHAKTGEVELHKRLLLPALALYVPFLVLTDFGYPLAALAGLVVLYLAGARYVLARVDWGLLLVFVLMFIDLRLVAQLGAVRQALDALALDNPLHLYWTGIGVSQIISNVPAAILLAEYSHDWPMIAFAVSAGGFGTLVGSLANLIALRMAGDRRAWLLFHAYSVPFLAVASVVIYAWLTWLR
ncbi:Inner membrane protein YbiR [Ralstonia condita]|uniref:Inner membrane protein YbiR n=1 Tax=Ralstonia condita TaxID=3058600 RepID=A0ABM9J5T5_9RALS|nr:anion transporter [Ralstonia sp. LMG 7141]CAJ0783535.1 Inner membrane protein YbiR [Ralstonia sp. LMG 7141]